jgi:hypothetical protein
MALVLDEQYVLGHAVVLCRAACIYPASLSMLHRRLAMLRLADEAGVASCCIFFWVRAARTSSPHKPGLGAAMSSQPHSLANSTATELAWRMWKVHVFPTVQFQI